MNRIILVLMAIGWSLLAYGLNYDLGYEKGTGHPSIGSNLLWAGMASFPFWLGIFVAGSRRGLLRILRWLCVIWLGLEAGYLAFTWLNLFAWPPALGMVLLLWPDIRGERKPNPPASARKRLSYAGLALAGLSAFMWWGWFYNPLPSDEAMLKHFNAHRSEFEKLAQGYRNFRGREVFYENSTDEVKALVKKLGVYHIVGAQGASGVWYPDPYSEKTMQTRKAIYQRSALDRPKTQTEIMEILRQEMPILFEGVSPISGLLDVEKVVSVIDISSSTLHDMKHRLRYFGTAIYKDYYHFPQPPRIEGGRILVPDYDFSDKLITRPGQRVFPSLDSYPSDWKRGECVLKRIDAHWFIAMCRTT